MKNKKLGVEITEEKPEYMALAARRTEGFTMMWMLHERAECEPRMNLQALVSSAYLQGVRDAYTALSHKKLIKDELLA